MNIKEIDIQIKNQIAIDNNVENYNKTISKYKDCVIETLTQSVVDDFIKMIYIGELKSDNSREITIGWIFN